MRLIFQILFVAILALGLGLGLTSYVTRTEVPFASITNGAWHAHPNVGKPDIDAYTLAHLSVSGEIPLAVVDGIAFRTLRDDEGHRLTGRCDYLLEGKLDSVPLWTLALTDEKGQSWNNPAHRYAFTSQDVMRKANGDIQVRIGSSARGGDWLPSPDQGYFQLHLSLYDVPANAFSERRSMFTLPRIVRKGCR